MDSETHNLRGVAVYMFAFDVAYEMADHPIKSLLGHPVETFKLDSSKRTPKTSVFYQPQMVNLPPVKCVGPDGEVEMERSIKLLPIGAISITIRIPFSVGRLEDLVDYHDLNLGDFLLHDEVRRLAQETYVELRPHLVRPLEWLAEEEAYTVFCIESSSVLPESASKAEDWLHNNRRQIAALLTQELDFKNLSDQEALESTSRYLSYYQNDLVVADWDAALVVDEPRDFADSLYIMELANLHLAELEAYDRLLDRALERAYRDLRKRRLRKRSEILVELREIRIDLARYNDELSNITKFFGDWHLARLYETISARFHLGDWHRNLDVKVKTVDSLYELLQHEQNNKWMLILEVTIVLLFIIDLVAIFMGK
jgi:hypothetical protein